MVDMAVKLLRRILKLHILERYKVSQMLFSVQQEKYALEGSSWQRRLKALSAKRFQPLCTFFLKLKAKVLCSFFKCQALIFGKKSPSLLVSSCWCEKQFGASIYITSSDAKNTLWSNRLDRKKIFLTFPDPPKCDVVTSFDIAKLEERNLRTGNRCSQTGLYHICEYFWAYCTIALKGSYSEN